MEKLMKGMSLSTKIYLWLVALFAILAGLSIYLPTFPQMLNQEMPASKPVVAIVNALLALFVYGTLGYIGLRLSRRLGYADVWDGRVTNRQRFIIPLALGVGTAVLLILADLLFSGFNGVGRLPHPPFPTSIVASLSAGIGEELLFRLFFIPFWVWLTLRVALKGRWPNGVFWVVAVISALAFGMGHLPAITSLYDYADFGQIPSALLVEILLLNSLISLLAAYLLRKYGFLAAAGLHFWTDVVWHVIWGLF